VYVDPRQSSPLPRATYDRPIGLGPQVVRLRPAPHCRTRVPSYSLKVTPAQHFVNWLQDPNGNWLARFVFPEKTREFEVTVDLIADMAVINPFDFFVEPFAETFPFAYPAEFAEELAPFLDAEPAGPLLSAFLASIPRNRTNIVDFLVGLNQRLHHEVAYLIRMEAGVQTPEQTLAANRARAATALGCSCKSCVTSASRRGSCRAISSNCDRTCLRSMGPQARRRISPTCTPGRRCTYPARAGSGSMPRPACCAGRAISRSPPRRISAPRRQSAVPSNLRKSPSPST
jgi:Transglutaminase-like enzymes, putative cysteine proteases